MSKNVKPNKEKLPKKDLFDEDKLNQIKAKESIKNCFCLFSERIFFCFPTVCFRDLAKLNLPMVVPF
jgi:hypothetical protein